MNWQRCGGGELDHDWTRALSAGPSHCPGIHDEAGSTSTGTKARPLWGENLRGREGG